MVYNDLRLYSTFYSQQFIALRPVIGAGGFKQGDGFGDGAALRLRVGAEQPVEKDFGLTGGRNE